MLVETEIFSYILISPLFYYSLLILVILLLLTSFTVYVLSLTMIRSSSALIFHSSLCIIPSPFSILFHCLLLLFLFYLLLTLLSLYFFMNKRHYCNNPLLTTPSLIEPWLRWRDAVVHRLLEHDTIFALFFNFLLVNAQKKKINK